MRRVCWLALGFLLISSTQVTALETCWDPRTSRYTSTCEGAESSDEGDDQNTTTSTRASKPDRDDCKGDQKDKGKK